MLKKIRTITSHVGLARYLALTDEHSIGEIPRQTDIPSPYHYSPTHVVVRHEKDGAVIWVETRHKHYEVFAVPREMIQNLDERSTEERRRDDERRVANEARTESRWRYDRP